MTGGATSTGILLSIALLIVACSHSTRVDVSPTPFLEEEAKLTFDQIDRNGDGRLGFEAFHRGLTVHYYFRQGLDLDGDGVVHHIELATALYELWDVNDDGSLEHEEWRDGLNAWFPEASDVIRLEHWDTDDDGRIGMVEFGEGSLRSSLYDPYDANGDGTTETEEVSVYLHRQWDTNDDGYVDRSEWRLPSSRTLNKH